MDEQLERLAEAAGFTVNWFGQVATPASGDAANTALEKFAELLLADERRRCAKSSMKIEPLTRDQIDTVMTRHYPLESLPRENLDAFVVCVRDIERLLGIGA